MMIIINSIVNIILFLVPYFFATVSFIFVVKVAINNVRLLRSFDAAASTPYKVGHLGYVINLSGKKGIGKTTTAAGIINYLIIFVRNKILDEMEKIRKGLNEVNFNVLENKFLDELEKCEFDHKLAFKRTIELYEFSKYYTDNLHIYRKEKMLEKYLKRFWILNVRSNYVLSKTSFFSPIVGENASHLDPSSLELRNVVNKRNYQFDIANIVFDDEKSIDSGNVYSNQKKIKLSGKKEHRALIRNAYEGLSYEVTTKQYDEDEIKLERKQIDASLNIRSRREINHSLLIVKVLKVIYAILLFPRKIIYFFSNYDEKMDKFKKSCCWLRNFEKWIDDIENIIKSKGFIVVYCRSYYDPDDVGKQNPELYERLKLVLEKELCYGSIDTHEWKALADYYDNYRDNAVRFRTSFFDDELKVVVWNKSINRE